MAIRRYRILEIVSTANSRETGGSECFIEIKFTLKDEGGKVSELQVELNMSEFNEFFREMEKINNMIEIIN